LKGGDIIFEKLLNKLSDIVVLSKINGYEIVHTKYKNEIAETIFKLFLAENEKKIIDNYDIEVEFEYKDKIFKVVAITTDDDCKLYSFQEISKLKEIELYKYTLEFLNQIQKKYIKKIFTGAFSKKDWKGFSEKFVKIFPNVDSASLILKDKDGFFSFISVYNHDIKGLKKLKLRKSDFHPKRFENVTVIKLDEVLEQYHFSTKRKKEITEILIKYGNLARIKSLISIPIFKDNECIGFLTLDSWEREDAFDNRIIKYFSKMLSEILSNLFQYSDLYEKSF